MIKEGSQLNAQRRTHTIRFATKTIMSTRVVEIWVLISMREHPGNGYQLFFNQY